MDHVRQQQIAAIAPTLRAGMSWLYRIDQPRHALVRPQGIALTEVAGRRFGFIPDVGGSAAVVVHVTPRSVGTPFSTRAAVLTVEELDDIVAVLCAHGGVCTRVALTSRSTSAEIRLGASAHPSLLSAVSRYRAGCPVHHSPTCGHMQIPGAQCRWFSAGFARLMVPKVPQPPAPPVSAPAISVTAMPQRAGTAPAAALVAANAHRRDQGAAQGVARARTAMAALSRRPHPSAATEEALRVLQLRVDHPQLSLRELGAAHRPPLTKDCYAARLRRALRLGSQPVRQLTDTSSQYTCIGVLLDAC